MLNYEKSINKKKDFLLLRQTSAGAQLNGSGFTQKNKHLRRCRGERGRFLISPAKRDSFGMTSYFKGKEEEKEECLRYSSFSSYINPTFRLSFRTIVRNLVQL
jgi:hypothetical protein